MKVVTIVGARPQFVKAAAVSQALKRESIDEVLLHTGQHYDAAMSDVFFRELEIAPPKYNLEIGSGTHGAMTGKMLEGIEKVLFKESPDWVVVYGDTNSTVAGALAATKLHIPVAHVEAGLRSYNKRMPEEINRILTDHCSDLLLTPSTTATRRLQEEGIDPAMTVEVGDVMVDAAYHYGSKAEKESPILEQLEISNGPYALLTLHRAENTDDPQRLDQILNTIATLSRSMPIVWPIHPRTASAIKKIRRQLPTEKHVHLIDPVGYLDMLRLLKGCRLVLTDSGGLQKEAYLYQRPCVTLRDETEWVELCERGYNRLVGADPLAIETAVRELQTQKLTWTPGLYGDGRAAERIARALKGKTESDRPLRSVAHSQ